MSLKETIRYYWDRIVKPPHRKVHGPEWFTEYNIHPHRHGSEVILSCPYCNSPRVETFYSETSRQWKCSEDGCPGSRSYQSIAEEPNPQRHPPAMYDEHFEAVRSI